MMPRETSRGRDGQTLPSEQEPRRLAHRAGAVSDFINFSMLHFNAGMLKEAGAAWADLIDAGGQMFLAMAGALSTAEIGRVLAEMIRQKKVSAISCTGASIEEDVFQLVAHDAYEHFPDYQNLEPKDDAKLAARHINRVTDTGIPETQAMTVIEDKMLELWQQADRTQTRKFPHEYLYTLLTSGSLESHYDIDPRDSWMLAAAEANLPLFVPGWEDSTLGNVFAAECLKGEIADPTMMKGGIEYMMALARWYTRASSDHPIGWTHLGGGIAADFAMCVVPLLRQDYGRASTPFWQLFIMVTDAQESYGGFSGALASEKASWGKIEASTPSFCINSDATIVFPLLAALVMDW